MPELAPPPVANEVPQPSFEPVGTVLAVGGSAEAHAELVLEQGPGSGEGPPALRAPAELSGSLLDPADANTGSRSLEQAADTSEQTGGVSPKTFTNPRTRLLVHLAEDLREAVLARDLEAARIAHEAIGRLLGSVTTSLGAAIEPLRTRGSSGGDP